MPMAPSRQARRPRGGPGPIFDEQQGRFGTRATIAGLMERERQCTGGSSAGARGRPHPRDADARRSRVDGLAGRAAGRHAEATRAPAERRARQGGARAGIRGLPRDPDPGADRWAESLLQARDRAARAQVALEQARADADGGERCLSRAERARQAAQDDRGRAPRRHWLSSACPCGAHAPRHPRDRAAVPRLCEDGGKVPAVEPSRMLIVSGGRPSMGGHA